MYKHSREWKDTLKRAKESELSAKQEKERKGDIKMLREFGFTEQDNSNWGTNKD